MEQQEILNSNNFKQKFEEFFRIIDENKKPEKELLEVICFYINDMRLLKNIVNEYLIQIKVASYKNINFNSLFSIILIKNLFPKEYDQLLKDKGVIFELILKIQNCDQILKEEYRKGWFPWTNNEEINEKINEHKIKNIEKLSFKEKKDDLMNYDKLWNIFEEVKCNEEKYFLIQYLVLNDFLDSNYFYWINY